MMKQRFKMKNVLMRTAMTFLLAMFVITVSWAQVAVTKDGVAVKDSPFATLEDAFMTIENEGAGNYVIGVLSDIDEESAALFAAANANITLDLKGHSVNCQAINVGANLTIKNGTLNAETVSNSLVGQHFVFTAMNSVVKCNDTFEWRPSTINMLSSKIVLIDYLYLGDDSFALTMDSKSQIELYNTSIYSAGQAHGAAIEKVLRKYVSADKDVLTVDDCCGGGGGGGGIVLTVDRTKSGIRVVRNDNGEEITNDAYLSSQYVGNKLTHRLDHVYIYAPASTTYAGVAGAVDVSVYIPAKLVDPYSQEYQTSSIASDAISCYNTDAVNVTDIYMPETDEAISLDRDAFRPETKKKETARVHTPLPLLDDYALQNGLEAEFHDLHVMSTIETNTRHWTLASGVDLLLPAGLKGYACQPISETEVAATEINSTNVTIDGKDRLVIKANNGVLIEGEPGEYDIVAWPGSAEARAVGADGAADPTGDGDARTYAGNMLMPVLVPTHLDPLAFYIMYNDAFHQLDPDDDSSVPACKAVLRKSNASQARHLSISFGNDNTTGISEVKQLDKDGDKWYDMMGNRIVRPYQKGIYIKNNQKVIIK